MVHYDGHIGLREGTLLVFTILSAMLFLQFPQYLISVGGTAGWQVALVVTGVAMLLLLPLGALAKRFPGQGLAEIAQATAGLFFGTVLTLVVGTWLFASGVLTLRNFTETFLVAILPNTPPSALMLVAMGCAIFASYKGLEAIARSTLILLPLIALGILLVLAFSLARIDTSLLFPLWGHGLVNTVTGGAYYASMAAEVIFLLASGYAFRDGKILRASGLWGTLLFGLGATATVAVLVGTFGAPIASQNPFPLFNLARIVYLGRFLQRTESLIVMFWFFAAAVRLSVLLHSAIVTLGGGLRLPAYRPLIFPLSTIMVALALVPKDYVTVLRLDRDWIRPSGFVILAVPALLWLLAAIRGKGAARDAC